MTDDASTPGAMDPDRLNPHLGTLLLGLALGAVLAVPVARLVFFSGPLGPLREAAAPTLLATGPPWGRGLWAVLSFLSLLRGSPHRRGLQAGACAAALIWFALPLLTEAAAHQVLTSVLQATFGALWAAGSWPPPGSRDRVSACVVGGLAVLLGVGMQLLNTRIRLG